MAGAGEFEAATTAVADSAQWVLRRRRYVELVNGSMNPRAVAWRSTTGKTSLCHIFNVEDRSERSE